MKVFDAYAKYYDLLYRDKDYKFEADYIIGFIRKYKPDARSILDLGCGTGRHDVHFAESNFDVTGVEISDAMFEIAKKIQKSKDSLYEINFVKEDIKRLRLKNKFDIVTSLFHVINYQTSNEDLRLTLKTVKEHLVDNGIFICDFWYGPGVLYERPESRVRKMEDGEYLVERIACPVLKINENIVEVNYRIKVKNLSNSLEQELIEVHRMRYLFLPELQLLADEQGMRIEHCEEWMTGNELSEKSWYGAAIIRSKDTRS